MQLINALGARWKKSLKEEKANLITLSSCDLHLIKNNKILKTLFLYDRRRLETDLLVTA